MNTNKYVIQCKNYGDASKNVFSKAWKEKYLKKNKNNPIERRLCHSVKNFQMLIRTCKTLFYRAANAVFAKVGRVASEEVTLHLFKPKCLPVLLYGLEVCPLVKSQISSLDFAVNLFFMKLFNTSRPNIEANVFKIGYTCTTCALSLLIFASRLLHVCFIV